MGEGRKGRIGGFFVGLEDFVVIVEGKGSTDCG